MDITQILSADFLYNEKNNAAVLVVGNMIVFRRRNVEQAKNKILEYLTTSLTYLDAL